MKKDGFSLIELALALIIIGIIAGPLIVLYNNYVQQQILNNTEGNMRVIQAALRKYAIENGKYPMPAYRNFGPGDARFGKDCTTVLPVALACTLPRPSCVGGDTTVCQTLGLSLVALPADNFVYIGDVPFATLGLPQRYIIDGFGDKFTYAVSKPLTDSAKFQETLGTIRVIDARLPAPQDTVGTTKNIHYVVVSHGRDRKGAFTIDGKGPVVPCSPPGADVENCNNNGVFNDNFDYTLPPPAPNSLYVRFEKDVPGASFYDDYIGYTTSTTGDIWTYSTSAATPNIYSRNLGAARVGIPGGATDTDDPNNPPLAKFDVHGNVRADQLQTNRLCVPIPNILPPPPATLPAPNCPSQTSGVASQCGCDTPGPPGTLVKTTLLPKEFLPDIIGGTLGPLATNTMSPADAGKPGGGINCGDLGMTGIATSDEKCANIYPTSIGSCPFGQAPTGFDASGHLICVLP